jgi:uncharacterized protein YjbI with pentapeptide repeats
MHPTDLQDAHMAHARLRETNLQGAYLVGTHLESANLRGANLTDACLVNAHLVGAHLENDPQLSFHPPTILTGAHLEGADLSNAYLQGAVLANASLTDAILTNANLSGAKGLTVGQIQAAQNWRYATFSPDMREKLHLTSPPKGKPPVTHRSPWSIKQSSPPQCLPTRIS